jgi:hypothetical protein
MNDTSPTAVSIRAWASRRHLPQSHLERWLALAEADAAALLALAEELHLRTGQLASTLELLEEIVLRERRTISAILAADDIRRAARGQGSAPARASAMLAKLRALRYPHLTAALNQINAEIAGLKLPSELHLLLPKDLSSDEFKIELTVRSAAQLEAALRALEERRPKLVRIIELLGGEHEV